MATQNSLPYLRLRGGVYIYRRRTPPGLEVHYGREIKRSLGTANPVDAARRWRLVHDEVEALIADLSRPVVFEPILIDAIDDAKILSLMEGQQLAAAGMPRRRTMMSMAYPEDPQYQPLPTRAPGRFFDGAIQAIERRHGWRFTDGLRETLRERFSYMSVGVKAPELMQRDWQLVNQVAKATRAEVEREAAVVTPSYQPMGGRQKPVTLDQLIDRFRGDLSRSGLAKTTTGNHTQAFDILRDMVGGDTDIRRISRDALKEVREILVWLPLYARKKPEFQGMSYREIAAITRAKDDEAQRRLDELDIDDPTEAQLDEMGVHRPLMRSAVNKYLGGISQLFQWATDEGLLLGTPGARLKLPPSGQKRKREFTTEELQRLFHKDFKLDSVSWMLLVCLHQGFRPGECAQLDAADLVTSDGGTACLRIAVEVRNHRVDERLRRAGDTDKKVKNVMSQRTIPIHDFLIKRGFLEYVRSRISAGERKMFAVTKYGEWGYYESARKQLVPLLVEAGVYSPETTLHSFRHTFAQALRQVAPEAQQVREAIGGWSVSGSAEINYGSSAFAPEVLKPWLDRVRFDGLFTHPRRD